MEDGSKQSTETWGPMWRDTDHMTTLSTITRIISTQHTQCSYGGWVTLCVVALSGGWPDWAVARGQCSGRNSSSIAITSTGASFLVICIFLLLSGSAWFFSRTLLEAFHNSQLFPRLPCIRNASVNNNPSGATEWHGYDLTNFLLHNAMFRLFSKENEK